MSGLISWFHCRDSALRIGGILLWAGLGVPLSGAERNSVGMNLEAIPAGHFSMGQAQGVGNFKAPWTEAKDGLADWDESPVREVEISQPFLLSATEVTNGQYEMFDPGHRAHRARGKISAEDDAAVVNVSWEEAVRFCQWLSEREGRLYRLPTEAEWEYACRAGTRTLFNTGDALPKGSQTLVPGQMLAYAHFFPAGTVVPEYYRVAESASLRVAQQGPNGWGLYDLHGNVAEWCADWYGAYDPAALRDPTGPADGDFRVVRGGAQSQFARMLRSANRSSMLPQEGTNWIGFRVVQGALTERVAGALPVPVEPAAVAAASPEPMAGAPFFQGPEPYVEIAKGAEGPLYFSHNHDPGITVCPNDDLLAIWYSTDEETGNELVVGFSRLVAGTDRWTKPALFWNCADVNNHAPALFTNTDGTIFHFNGNKLLPGSVVRTSKDNGLTWSRAVKYSAATQPGEATIRTRDGRILATFDGSTFGLVTMSADEGKTWQALSDERVPPQIAPGKTGTRIAGFHVGLVERRDGTLWALGRFDDAVSNSHFDHHLPQSTSSDGGRTWTYAKTDFPSISSGQRFTLKRLQEGPLLLCSFTDELGKKDAAGKIISVMPLAEMKGMPVRQADGSERTGYGLYAAVSFDDGATWPIRRLVTPGGPSRRVQSGDGGSFQMDDTHAEQNGYLAMCQGRDGMIHLISSRNSYEFNLPWLLEGTPAGARLEAK